MRISLKVGAALYPLAGQAGVDERVHSSAGDFQLHAQAARTVLQRVRAASAPSVDRGNLQTTISFSTSRLLASAAEAFLYCLDHDRSFPRAGTVVMEAVGITGGISKRWLLGAVFDPPQRRAVGCTALLSYTVTGSEIVIPSLVISGIATPSTANGTVLPAPLFMGKQAWSTNGLAVNAASPPAGQVVVFWNGGIWNVARMDATYLYRVTSAADWPVGLSGWTAITGSGAPSFTET